MGYSKITTTITERESLVASFGDASVVIDCDDRAKIEPYHWRMSRLRDGCRRGTVSVPEGRLRRKGSCKYCRMPRLLMGLDSDDKRTVVHIRDGDGTNMRKENLVATSHSVIQRELRRTTNTSGITWIPRKRWWQVYVALDGKRLYVGIYRDLKRAICEHQKALEKLAVQQCDSLLMPVFTLDRLRSLGYVHSDNFKMKEPPPSVEPAGAGKE